MQFQRLVLPFANKSRHAALLALAPLPAPRAPALRHGRAQGTTRKTNQPNFRLRGTSLEPTQRGGLAGRFSGGDETGETLGPNRAGIPRRCCLLNPSSRNPNSAGALLKTTGFGTWQLQNTKKTPLEGSKRRPVFCLFAKRTKTRGRGEGSRVFVRNFMVLPVFLVFRGKFLTPHSPKN